MFTLYFNELNAPPFLKSYRPPCDTNTGGGGNSIPYCDERTCTNSCIQFMQYNRGKCLKNECYCEKISKEPTKPKPVLVEDWNYISQDGKIMKFFDKR